MSFPFPVPVSGSFPDHRAYRHLQLKHASTTRDLPAFSLCEGRAGHFPTRIYVRRAFHASSGAVKENLISLRQN